MKRKKVDTLLERFGAPLDPVMGTRIGDEPGITTIGAVGVRDMKKEDAVVCPVCGEMPIGGSCGCDDSDVCPMCGQMPPQVAAPCSCGGGGLNEAKDTCDECGMNQDVCECGMNEAKTCSECGMSEAVCECGMNEVAPPGHEKMVKGLKKAGNVENPWAVAWAHYGKKHPGGRGKRHQ